MSLTDSQVERYSRQIILKDVGGIGQEKLLASKVLIIGAGGLGSPAALYLAAAGVGTIGIADGDNVDLSNLQRQIIHFTGDIGVSKAESAMKKMQGINPDVKVNIYRERICADNAAGIIQDYDFIIDGTDNFPAKFLINDACVLAKKPFSHAGILRFDGQAMTYTPGNACYRCVFPAIPPKGVIPTCSQAGILGPVAGILGTIQAAEALKYIINKGSLLTNRLLIMNAFDMEFRTVTFKRNLKCPVCGENPAITELTDYEQPACDISSR
jgi:adenylyltransferase/sulfurtransferase